MTGWRIGFCGGPKDIVAAMSTIQGQSTSNASSISQRAATVALNSDQACVAEMNKAFKERHDFVVAGLNAIPGISCQKGAGTFYAFADVHGAMRNLGLKDDNAFAEYLSGRSRCRGRAGLRIRSAGTHAYLVRHEHESARGCAPAHRAGAGLAGCAARGLGSRGTRAEETRHARSTRVSAERVLAAAHRRRQFAWRPAAGSRG